jgi:hypothetical protein
MSEVTFSLNHPTKGPHEVSEQDLFNPVKNPFWNDGTCTLQNWFDFLKAFYTRENIQKSPCMFVKLLDVVVFSHPRFSNTYGYKNLFNDVFKTVPDELLWTLALIQLVELNSTPDPVDETYSFKLTYKTLIPTSNISDGVYLNTLSSSPAQVYNTKTPADFLKSLRSVKKEWEETFNTYHASLLNTSYSTVHNGIFSLTFLAKFFCNSKIFQSLDGTINGSTLYNLLTTKNAKLNVNYSKSLNTIYSVERFQVTIPVSKTFRDPLYKLLDYKANPMDYLSWPLTLPNEHPRVLYGIELECCGDYTIKELINAPEDPFFIAKHDGSIKGSKPNNYELVTVPGTIKAFKKLYADWFSKLDYTKFDCTTDTGNGMHIHVGRSHFIDEQHVQRFCWFFHHPANTEFIVTLSERGTLQNMTSCTPIYNFRSTSSKFENFKNITSLLHGHRGATNLGDGRKKTVEVRIFKGIVSYASIIKNLEAVDAVFHFTQDATFSKLTTVGFFEWLEKTPGNQYTVLKSFIKTLKVPELSARCVIKDLVFTEKNPERIYQKVMKSGIKLTHMHVTALNRITERRHFTLSKETNELQLIRKNIGKLAHLDRTLQDKYLFRRTQEN